MTGNALAMAGAFSFLLLSIWMAMWLGRLAKCIAVLLRWLWEARGGLRAGL